MNGRSPSRWSTPAYAAALGLSIYVSSRLASTLIMLHVSVPTQLAGLSKWDRYWRIIAAWDGEWYAHIAEDGYDLSPSIFVDPVRQNSIAFFPLFPMLCRAVSALTHLDFAIVAGSISLSAGAAAVGLLHEWMTRTRGCATAVVITTTLCVFPTSPILQCTYPEALALLLVTIGLRALATQRLALLAVIFVVLGLTRPIVAPLVFTSALILWGRFRDTPRHDIPWRRIAPLLGIGVTSVLVWPAIAGILAGQPFAFFQTQTAWVPAGGLKGGWFVGLWLGFSPVLALGLTGILAYAIYTSTRRRGSSPDPVPLWGGVYLGWILLTTVPSTSISRYILLTLLPLGPLAIDIGSSAARRVGMRWLFVTVIVGELALQWLWVSHILVRSSAGWGYP